MLPVVVVVRLDHGHVVACDAVVEDERPGADELAASLCLVERLRIGHEGECDCVEAARNGRIGTGQALALAAKGDADVTLVHAPTLEKQYVAEGKLLNRRLIMYNDFVIIGPKDDPAKIKASKAAVSAMQLIAQAKARFVSRGDNSGTHTLEKTLWKEARIEPKGQWYIEAGLGMAATLGVANERNGYTITDRGTYLALQKRLTLPILIEGDRALLNIYSVMEINSANGARINTAGGRALADFMVSPQTQALIKTFGVEKFGEPLFVPVAGKREEDLGV